MGFQVTQGLGNHMGRVDIGSTLNGTEWEITNGFKQRRVMM